MIRVADVIMRFLAERGVGDVFSVSGGGIMYLVDALGLETRLRYRINNHEQASAIAADPQSRISIAGWFGRHDGTLESKSLQNMHPGLPRDRNRREHGVL